MSGPRLSLVSFALLASLLFFRHAHAEPLELALSRLSTGQCALTTGHGPLALRFEGAETLRTDELAFRKLALQLGAALAPSPIAPVTSSGPLGLELALETSLTEIDEGADYWERGTRGSGESLGCDGRNDAVRTLLVGQRLHLQKGLPFGFTLGATVGKLFATGLYLVGAELKFALLEEVWDARLPDLALRAALAKTVGGDDFALLTTTIDALVSKRFVLGSVLALSPYMGAGATFARAWTATIDLTPNIDAVACRDGLDSVCNAGGLGASRDDLGHDVRFPSLTQLRYRGFAGFALHHRSIGLSCAAVMDLLPPHVGDRAQGPSLARQWSVSMTPSLRF